MSFLDIAQTRRSCHDFVPGFKIAEDQFLSLLEAVRFTPSGYNAQPWQFDLIQDQTTLQTLGPICYNQPHIQTAGNLVVVLGELEFGIRHTQRIIHDWIAVNDLSEKQIEALQASLVKKRKTWKDREMTLRSTSLAAMSFLYAATDLGLATCPMMGFKQLELKKHRQYPDHLWPVLLIALGKGKENLPARPPRLKAEDLWYQKA